MKIRIYFIAAFGILIIFLYFSSVSFAASGDTIVHKTKTGYCYHRADCFHLRSDITITLREAISEGLSPCEDCNPPILDEDEVITAKEANSKPAAGSSISAGKTSVADSLIAYESETGNLSIQEEESSGTTIYDKYSKWVIAGLTIVIIMLLIENVSLKKELKKEAEKFAAEKGNYERSVSEQKVEIDKLKNDNQEKENLINILSDTEKVNQLLTTISLIPKGTKFLPGRIPYDNLTGEKYGSYTVYISPNGKRYHKRKGCSSANIETNIVTASSYGYLPCNVCCKQKEIYPKWYDSYIRFFKFIDSRKQSN